MSAMLCTVCLLCEGGMTDGSMASGLLTAPVSWPTHGHVNPQCFDTGVRLRYGVCCANCRPIKLPYFIQYLCWGGTSGSLAGLLCS